MRSVPLLRENNRVCLSCHHKALEQSLSMVLADPMAQCMTAEIWEEGEDSLTGMAPSTDHDYPLAFDLAFDSVWRFHDGGFMRWRR